jgi:hypothetical protein
MMLCSNVGGGAVTDPDVSGPSLAANLKGKTSPATAVDPEETSELILGQASGQETLVSCPTALASTEQTPAETDEDLQATANIEARAAVRETLSSAPKNVVAPRAPVPGSLEDALAATSAAGSLFAPVPHFMPGTAPELKAQPASAATTVHQIREVAAIAAATVPARSPAATSTDPQSPDRGGVSAVHEGQPNAGHPTGPIQAAGNGFAFIAATAPVQDSSNLTIVPATARSRTYDHGGSPPVAKSARLATPTASDDTDTDSSQGSTSTSTSMALGQEPSAPAIAPMHPTATAQPSSAMPIQTVASPEALGSTQSTNGKANPQTIPLHNDSPTPQTGNPTLPTPTLQAGRILERMGQSEMHVGVKTADFGTIEVHASLSQDRVGASLSTSHADLRSAMEAELPSLQQAISRHHLQLDAFDVASHTGGRGGDTSNHSRSRSSTNGQASPILPSRESESVLSAPTSSSWMPPYSSRLSVIA